MTPTLERAWVRVLDSQAWRRLARSTVGSRILGSGRFNRLDTMRRYVLTRSLELRHPNAFDTVETCVLFLGHVKSGGSLLGALLDAHPGAAMADEVDVARYVDAGFSRDQVFHLLVKGARRESMKGRITARRLTPYSLAVPDQWQGAFRTLKVIGESRAGPTTRRFGQDPELLDRVRRTMKDVDVKFIHIVRSPFDPIGAMVARSGKSLDVAIAEYSQRCEVLSGLRERIDPTELVTVGYEDLIRDPAGHLEDLCRFVGLEPGPGYLEACAGIVRRDRPQERDAIMWSDGSVDHVRRVIQKTDFLNCYRGERPGERARQCS